MIPPGAREKLESYLEFQKEMGVERVRFSRAAVTPQAANAAPLPSKTMPSRASTTTHAVSNLFAPESLPMVSPPADPVMALAVIQEEIGPNCMRCKLHGLGRKQIVFGTGNPRAELVFVGEGPGADEDEQGIPFVGRAGQLLTDMIQKGMGLRRSDVYICNVVKCRPPGNRTPEPDESATCSPFLMRQIAAIQPRIVCALGAVAAQTLRPYRGPLTSIRGRVHTIEAGDFPTKLVVTYHPAYLLRDPSQKKEAWKDLQIVMRELGLTTPGS